MTKASRLKIAPLALLATVALSGCMTDRIKPQPSAAIREARAHRERPATPACPATALAEVSPVFVGFPFAETELADPMLKVVDGAAAWLVCHPGVQVVIRGDADVHGDAAAQNLLADRRAKVVAARLRSAGATLPVIQILPRGAPDPAAGVLFIKAEGQRW